MAFGAVSPPALEPIIDAATHVDHRCEYHVRDLGTRSVTLFPTRAHVVRDIKNVPLKTGTNQIAVLGLTPTLDENSVKIGGTGYALITNLVIKLLPNREIFDNVFTESDDGDDNSDNSDTDSPEQNDDDSELEAVSEKIRQLEDENKAALEAVRSAESRLNILEVYGHSMAAGNEGHSKTSFEDGMKIYRNERAEIFRAHREGETKARDNHKQMLTLKKLEDRLRTRVAKRRSKARAARDREIEKQRRKNLEQAKEKERYWPKKVYVITVNVDVKSAPDDDEGLTHDDVDIKMCDLTLSYVASHAFWSPIYNMSLSSTSNSGVLYFEACLTNQTSETWDKCNIALSTSQTEFSSRCDSVPTLVPRNVSLTHKFIPGTRGTVLSNDEMRSWALPVKEQNTCLQLHELFGVERPSLHHHRVSKPYYTSSGRDSTHDAVTARAGRLFGQAKPAFGTPVQLTGGGLFGNHQPPPANGGVFGNSRPADNNSRAEAQNPQDLGHTDSPEKNVSNEDNCSTLVSLQPDLEFEESSFEETGLTTTYTLAGLKSLSPSSTTSRHRVTRMA
ncbi:hypothetical protein CHU98_g7808 [Xylaria longipes]|nr:hypothetical protein CHU98_g7808 [Xylaria longipes]